MNIYVSLYICNANGHWKNKNKNIKISPEDDFLIVTVNFQWFNLLL